MSLRGSHCDCLSQWPGRRQARAAGPGGGNARAVTRRGCRGQRPEWLLDSEGEARAASRLSHRDVSRRPGPLASLTRMMTAAWEGSAAPAWASHGDDSSHDHDWPGTWTRIISLGFRA